MTDDEIAYAKVKALAEMIRLCKTRQDLEQLWAIRTQLGPYKALKEAA